MKYKFDDIAFNSTTKKKPVDSDKHTYIGLEHLDSGCFTISRWGAESAPEGDKLLIKKGDVLFGKRRAYQRKVGIAPFDGIFSAHGMVLRAKEDVIDKDFFPFFIASDQFMETAVRISVGGLSPTINWRDLREQEFELPSLEQQHQIAKKLWAAYNLREAYKRLCKQIDETVKSQFIEMLNSNGYSEIPLGQLCKKITDGSHNPPKGIDISEYIMISSKNVYKDGLDLSDVRYLSKEEFEIEDKRTRCSKGDVLLTIVGTIGRAYLIRGDEGNIVMQRSVAVLSPNEKIMPQFLTYSLHIDEELEKEGRGNAQKGVYLKELAKYKIKVPSITIQRGFEAILNQADKSKFGNGFKSQFIEMFGGDQYKQVELDTLAKDWQKGQAFKKDNLMDDGKHKCIHYGELFTKYGPIIDCVLSSTNDDMIKGSKMGDILFPASDVTPDGLARCSALMLDDVLLGGDIIVLRPQTNNIPEYLSWAINMQKDQLLKRVTGSVVRHLSAKGLKTVTIPVPHKEKQQQFISIVRQADKSKSVCRQAIKRLAS